MQLESQAAAHLRAGSHAVFCCDLACNFLGSLFGAGFFQEVKGPSQLLCGELVLQKLIWPCKHLSE